MSEQLTSVVQLDSVGDAVELNETPLGREWASFEPVEVTAGRPESEVTKKVKVGTRKTGFLSRENIYEDRVEVKESTLSTHVVDAAKFRYNHINHEFIVDFDNLRLVDQTSAVVEVAEKVRVAAELVAERAKDTAVGFWEAIRAMATTALGRLSLTLITPVVLAALIWGAISIPWTSINVVPVFIVLAYILSAVVIMALPVGIAAGLLWVFTPSKPKTDVKPPKITVEHGIYPWQGIRVDTERTQKETHARLLPLMKKFAYRQALPIAMSVTALIFGLAYAVVSTVMNYNGIFNSDVNGTLLVSGILLAVGGLGGLFGETGYSQKNIDETANSFVLHVESYGDVEDSLD